MKNLLKIFKRHSRTLQEETIPQENTNQEPEITHKRGRCLTIELKYRSIYRNFPRIKVIDQEPEVNLQSCVIYPGFPVLVPVGTYPSRKESLMFHHFENYGLPDNCEYTLKLWARYEKWKEITETWRNTRSKSDG